MRSLVPSSLPSTCQAPASARVSQQFCEDSPLEIYRGLSTPGSLVDTLPAPLRDFLGAREVKAHQGCASAFQASLFRTIIYRQLGEAPSNSTTKPYLLSNEDWHRPRDDLPRPAMGVVALTAAGSVIREAPAGMRAVAAQGRGVVKPPLDQNHPPLASARRRLRDLHRVSLQASMARRCVRNEHSADSIGAVYDAGKWSAESGLRPTSATA
jgi:hypothetical protein